MNLQSWIEQMQTVLGMLNEREEFGMKDRNVILPPSSPALMDEIEHKFQTKLPSSVREFYTACDGINIPDVGYFIASLGLILRSVEQLVPLKIEGEHAGSILTIGDNGTEDYFAVCTDDREEVLLLPEGLVEDAIYSDPSAPIQVLASDFNGFLERLLADTQATLRGDEHWPYMTSWEE